MDLNFQILIPRHFNDNAQVWIYQSNRLFTSTEALSLKTILKNFTKNWKSHGTPVHGYANLFFNRFIILMADETSTGSNFSTYTSLRLIKNIAREYHVELFDRLMLGFIIQERIQLLPLAQLNAIIEKDLITSETIYFNNSILTKRELLNNWIIPIKDSWLSSRIIEKDKARSNYEEN